jgi:hypothetical protein
MSAIASQVMSQFSMNFGRMEVATMTFQISNDRLQELLKIEESVNCDIGAGIDHGANLGAYLSDAMQYVDRSKLVAFLQSELGELLPIADLEAIAHQVQRSVHQSVQRRSA